MVDSERLWQSRDQRKGMLVFEPQTPLRRANFQNAGHSLTNFDATADS